MKFGSRRRDSSYRIKSYGIDHVEKPQMIAFGVPPQNAQPPPDFREELASQVMEILSSLGVKRDPEISNINMKSVREITYDIGDKEVAGRENSNLYNIQMHSVATSVRPKKGKRSIHPNINGFERAANGLWFGVDENIKIKDHVLNEPLVCPECGRRYTHTRDVLLAQTVGIHDIMLGSEERRPDGLPLEPARFSLPHILLTPICPQCYADHLYKSYIGVVTGSDSMDDNLSPVFTIPDGARKIVPLLPECFAVATKTEANEARNLSALLYWPTRKEYGVCFHMRKEYMHYLENLSNALKKQNTRKEHVRKAKGRSKPSKKHL